MTLILLAIIMFIVAPAAALWITHRHAVWSKVCEPKIYLRMKGGEA